MTRRTVAVIQARMGSTRLPGKTLMRAAGKPLLAHLIERLRRARRVDQIVVATTVNPEDDAIEALCRALVGVGCFRGSVDDVLGRVVAALVAFSADIHVEVHGDGPLPDWNVVDGLIGAYLDGGHDVVTNAQTVTYPPGLDAWVYSTRLLAAVERVAAAPEHRESPSLYLLQHPERYGVLNREAPAALRRPDVYLEVDTAADFEVVRGIMEALYPANPAFTTEDVLRFLDAHPDLAARNRDVERRWKAFVG